MSDVDQKNLWFNSDDAWFYAVVDGSFVKHHQATLEELAALAAPMKVVKDDNEHQQTNPLHAVSVLRA